MLIVDRHKNIINSFLFTLWTEHIKMIKNRMGSKKYALQIPNAPFNSPLTNTPITEEIKNIKMKINNILCSLINRFNTGISFLKYFINHTKKIAAKLISSKVVGKLLMLKRIKYAGKSIINKPSPALKYL